MHVEAGREDCRYACTPADVVPMLNRLPWAATRRPGAAARRIDYFVTRLNAATVRFPSWTRKLCGDLCG